MPDKTDRSNRGKKNKKRSYPASWSRRTDHDRGESAAQVAHHLKLNLQAYTS